MKAFTIKKYAKDSLPELTEIAKPSFGKNDILVKIKAAGLNPLDIKTRDGEFKKILPYPLPYIPGNDFAGVIEAIGDNVTDFKVGDAVYGLANARRIGTFAEYIATNKDDVSLIPAGIEFTDAAALPLVSLAAWQVLTEVAKLKPSQKVLIHAGSGGFGLAAIQIAKSLGAFVATTCGPENIEIVKNLGADVAINYSAQKFETELANFDLVIETVGGKNLTNSMKVLKTGGLLVSLVGPPDIDFVTKVGAKRPIQFAVKLMSHSTLKMAKKLGVRYQFLFVRSSGSQLSEISKLVESGKLKAVVGKVVNFEEVPELFKTNTNSAKVVGKTVIQVP